VAIDDRSPRDKREPVAPFYHRDLVAGAAGAGGEREELSGTI